MGYITQQRTKRNTQNCYAPRVAALLVADLKSKGIEQPDTFQQQIGERRNTAVNSVAMGLLPRGQKLRPLVSEFGHYVQFAIEPDMDAKIILQDLVKGARITDRKLLTGGDMRVSGRVNASLQYFRTSRGSRKHEG